MYKGASRAMLHAHGIDRVNPGAAAIAGVGDPDLITSADNMGVAECRAELAQLGREAVRVQNELAIAKRERNLAQQKFLGHQEQAIIRRRMPIKKRLWTLERELDADLLAEAVKALVDADTAKAIFAEVTRRRAERAA